MATSSVFNLTRFTSLAAGDVIPAVDISDLTQSAHGSLDAITVTNFFATIPVPVVVTSASANALAIGRQGATSPAFLVHSSTASQATGVQVTGKAAAAGVAIAAISSGANESVTVDGKGTGEVVIGSVSTGGVPITAGRAVTTFGVGGATPAATGSGITFPAAQSASSDANTLDDYERGTFTPAVGGTATYTTQVGRYVKDGKWVRLTCTLTINSIGSGSATTISGLPFASANTGQTSAGTVSKFANSAVACTALLCEVTNNAATVTFNTTAAAQATSDNGRGIWQNSTSVTFEVFYEAA